MSLYQALHQRSDLHDPAIIIPDGPELSYAKLVRVVRAFQVDLGRLGLASPTAVSLALGNSLEFAVTFLALAFSSLTVAPLNPAYTQAEFEFYIGDMDSAVVLLPQGAVAAGHKAVAAAANFNATVAEVWYDETKGLIVLDVKVLTTKVKRQHQLRAAPGPPADSTTAFVLHTSGTTGRPKAVPLTHKNMGQTARNIIKTYALSRTDRSYLVMPLFHVHGLLCGLLAPLASGGTVIVAPKFSASQFWRDFGRYRATWYTAVPTIHQILLKSPLPEPLPKIRFIRSCSSSLAPATFHQLEKTFGAPVVEAYAMTEACHQMTSNNLPPGVRKPGTVGMGQGVEVVILDDKDQIVAQGVEGEIAIKGDNVTPGYINNPKANAESFTSNGYFRTGDQGKKDADGFVIITGRIKELINRGGEKISPIELDGVMLGHPAVAEAVAFAAPDQMYGQQVNAAIVLKPGSKASEKDIQEFMLTRVAKFKIPVRVFFTDVMPKTATGKIQRRNIAAKFLPKAKL